jgi:hypothetical protein
VLDTEILFQSSASGASAGGANTGVDYSNVKGAFFANIADVARLAGGTVTKKWFLFNDSPLDSLISPSVWLQTMPRYITEELGLGFDSASDADAAQGNMTAFSTDAVVSLRSSASDTRLASIWGLDAVGAPLKEDVTLTGTSEVLSVGTFSVVYAVNLASIDAGLTVTVKEGAGGTTRGTIGPSKLCCWLWLTVASKGAGIRLPDLAAQTAYGFWDRLTWAPAVAGARPNISVIAVEEN